MAKNIITINATNMLDEDKAKLLYFLFSDAMVKRDVGWQKIGNIDIELSTTQGTYSSEKTPIIRALAYWQDTHELKLYSAFDLTLSREKFVAINEIKQIYEGKRSYYYEISKELDFEDFLSCIYLSARMNQYVFDKTHVDEVFKAYAELVLSNKIETEDYFKPSNKIDFHGIEMYNADVLVKLSAKFLKNQEPRPSASLAWFTFLHGKNLIAPHSIDPKESIAKNNVFSNEESEYLGWISSFASNESKINEKPSYSALNAQGLSYSEGSSPFSKIFKANKSQNLELEF